MATTKSLVFLVAAAAALLMGSAADTYDVGDDLGWTIPPAGEVAYQTWARLKDFDIGDTIRFSWTGSHTVVQVSKAGYDSCNATNDLGLGLGLVPVQTVSPYNFILNSTDPQYFICTVGDHCSRGQKVTIEVRDFSAATPSLTTAAFSAVSLAAAAVVSLLI